jgi:hypothetical protein
MSKASGLKKLSRHVHANFVKKQACKHISIMKKKSDLGIEERMDFEQILDLVQ